MLKLSLSNSQTHNGYSWPVCADVCLCLQALIDILSAGRPACKQNLDHHKIYENISGWDDAKLLRNGYRAFYCICRWTKHIQAYYTRATQDALWSMNISLNLMISFFHSTDGMLCAMAPTDHSLIKRTNSTGKRLLYQSVIGDINPD